MTTTTICDDETQYFSVLVSGFSLRVFPLLLKTRDPEANVCRNNEYRTNPRIELKNSEIGSALTWKILKYVKSFNLHLNWNDGNLCIGSSKLKKGDSQIVWKESARDTKSTEKYAQTLHEQTSEIL